MTQIVGLVTILVAAQAATSTPHAAAQCAMAANCNRVSADAKGALGGGIIGAEIGFMIPALMVSAGVREMDEWWAFVLFPAVFAAGGAVAGYFALEDPTTMSMGETVRGFPEAAVAVLAVGIALIVPTFVGVLALTSYNPGASEGNGASGDEDAAGDESGSGSDASSGDPAAPAESEQASALRRTLAGGPGLVRFDNGQLLLGLPMVYAADTYTQEERAHMHLGASQDLRIPIVSGVF